MQNVLTVRVFDRHRRPLLSQHLAEKIHAYVKPRASGESTRVQDLVDTLLIATHMPVAAAALRAARQVTFAVQDPAAPPFSLPAPPAAWTWKYQRLAQDVGLDDTSRLRAPGPSCLCAPSCSKTPPAGAPSSASTPTRPRCGASNRSDCGSAGFGEPAVMKVSV